MQNENVALLPPLRGDGYGRYRVHIVGNSGAGKSTLATELASILGVSYINLDGLYWEPGWKKLSDDDFRKKVRAAMDQSDKGWVIDGSYSRVLGTIVDDEATDIIWLDPPFALYFPRLCLRTVWRLLRLAPPCSPGCDERIREVFFSSDSIVWWCITNHRVVQKRESERYRTESIHVGGRMRRIGGWGGELVLHTVIPVDARMKCTKSIH